jgi:molybdate transport system ATP-binding protein
VSTARSKGLAIELVSVSLRRTERNVLRSLDWKVSPGERWVVIGPNGAGKTQLLKLLAGDVWPTPRPGSKRLYHWRGERFDEPYGVKEEIAYVGAERQDRYEHYEWNLTVKQVVGTGIHRTDIPLYPLSSADRHRVHTLLKSLRLASLATRPFLTLSYGQRRMVLLARALAWQPKLFLFDELLNGLDTARRHFIKHRLGSGTLRRASWVLDIPAAATHALMLESGRVVWHGRLTNSRLAKLRRAAPTGASLRGTARVSRTARAAAALPDNATAHAPTLISLCNAWVWLEGRAVLKRLTFDIAQGQCWVVHGPNGCGKSTLVRALYGDLGVAAMGSIRRRGIESGVPISEFKRRVGIVAPELQTTHALHLTVLDVVVSGWRSSVGLDERPRAAERRSAMAALRATGIERLASCALRELSYGQLRRVLFARARIHQPDILLLDEPYTGLDGATRRSLHAWVDAWIKAGNTLLLTSHHLDEWPLRASHELQLDDGRAAYCGPVRRTLRT